MRVISNHMRRHHHHHPSLHPVRVHRLQVEPAQDHQTEAEMVIMEQRSKKYMYLKKQQQKMNNARITILNCGHLAETVRK